MGAESVNIANVEHRQEGDRAISLVVLAFSFAVVVTALTNTIDTPQPWQASIYIARGLNPDTATYDLDRPDWRSQQYIAPRSAVDAALARLANFGLPDDTTPLVN